MLMAMKDSKILLLRLKAKFYARCGTIPGIVLRRSMAFERCVHTHKFAGVQAHLYKEECLLHPEAPASRSSATSPPFLPSPPSSSWPRRRRLQPRIPTVGAHQQTPRSPTAASRRCGTSPPRLFCSSHVQPFNKLTQRRPTPLSRSIGNGNVGAISSVQVSWGWNFFSFPLLCPSLFKFEFKFVGARKISPLSKHHVPTAVFVCFCSGLRCEK